MKTYIACLTPSGTGAIAALAIRGPNAWTVTRELFQPLSIRQQGADAPRTPLPEVPRTGRFWLGKLGQDVADEVVVAVKQTTPVPWVEVHCHGGVEVVRLLMEAFQQKEVRGVTWPELERLSGDVPWRAAAITALARAPTVRTAAILLDQYHGAFDRPVQAAVAALDCGNSAKAGQLLEELCRYTGVGRHLTEPWRVVIAGAPNVGKSSLVNALAGYQRSVVSTIPGTTRDVVTTPIAVDGWPVELADTAGMRDETESLEAQGIERAHGAMANADLCLWVLDASAAPVWPSPLTPQVRLVINKVDLPPAWDLSQAGDAIPVSALTGAGLPALCERLAECLVPEAPPAGAAVPFTVKLCEKLEEAKVNLSSGQVNDARQVLSTIWEGVD